MLVYFADEEHAVAQGMGRHHPWHGSEHGPQFRHYDFVRHPELIRTSLEDLQPLVGTEAAEGFYEFLEWANGPKSLFETNDCGVRAIRPNGSSQFHLALERPARVVVLARDLAVNTDLEMMNRVGRLFEAFTRQLPGLPACFGYWFWPHLFTALGNTPTDPLGYCLGLSLWAWGDDEAEVDSNFGQAMRGLVTIFEQIQIALWPDRVAALNPPAERL